MIVVFHCQNESVRNILFAYLADQYRDRFQKMWVDVQIDQISQT